MKILHLEYKNEKSFHNLGAKIKIEKLNSILNTGDAILFREIKGELQMDFRLRRVASESNRKNFFFIFTTEFGKKGFDTYTPRPKTSTETKKFGSFREFSEFFEKSYKIKEADWLIK